MNTKRSCHNAKRPAVQGMAEEQLLTTLEIMEEGYFACDANWRLVYVNAAAERVLGINRKDVIGKSLWEAYPLTLDSRVEQEYRRAAAGEICDFEVFYEPFSLWFDLRCFPRSGGGMSVYFQDITERKKIEESMRRSEERFRTTMELSPDIISIIAQDGTLIYNSPAALSIHGYTNEELAGRNTFELIHPDDRSNVNAALVELLNDPSRKVSVQYRYRNKDGSYTWMEARSSNQLSNPNLSGLVVISRDITERKQMETELRNSQEMYCQLVNNLQNAVVYQITAPPEGGRRFTYVSRAVERLNELTVEEVLADAGVIYSQFLPEYHHVVNTLEEKALKNLTTMHVEVQSRLPSGKLRWFEFTSSPRTRGDGLQVWDGVEVDVTDRKNSEILLHESEERFRQFMDNNPALAWMKDEKGRYVYLNKAYERRFNVSITERLGKTDFDIWPREIAEQFRKNDMVVLENGHTLEVTEEAITDEANRSFWRSIKFGFQDESGNRYVGGIGIDITEQKRIESELAQAKEDLERQVTERTASLTLINAELAREIEERKRAEQHLLDQQHKLQTMGLEISFAAERERTRIAGELHDQVGQTLILSRIKLDALASRLACADHVQAVEELQQMIDQTITDIRSLTFQLRPPILATAGLVPAVQWLAQQLNEKYGLDVTFEQDSQSVLLNYEKRSCIFQALRELLINVVKHAGTNHAIISLEREADHVMISVSDEGCGFDVATARVNWNASTAGFGIFNIEQQIEYLGGRFIIDSTEGRGTRATIIAPLAPETPED